MPDPNDPVAIAALIADDNDKKWGRDRLKETIERFVVQTRGQTLTVADAKGIGELIHTFAKINYGLAATRTELSGPGGAPLTIEAVSKLTEAQLDALIATNDVRVLTTLAAVSVPHGDDRETEAGAGPDSGSQDK
jgi:hypothetical protein